MHSHVTYLVIMPDLFGSHRYESQPPQLQCSVSAMRCQNLASRDLQLWVVMITRTHAMGTTLSK